ncbi:MAG: serine/threonine protein kinase [Bifidobacteriaceae bacterium]|jgi:serine/threonine-protein kinase|nr:serine/threonine protein kinase [Bifidobacteriaceae bacterium]
MTEESIKKFKPGDVIHGRYVLEEIIAEGGMGQMFKGFDRNLNRPVAIKTQNADAQGGQEFLKRLRIEAMNSASLIHQNIVSIHDYQESNNFGFLIMEYVESKSLAQILQEVERMTPQRILPLLAQVLFGLAKAHRENIIHRDIKPSNILVTTDGHAKVTDFGVSKASNQKDITANGMVMGTAQYLSPEQAVGKDATSLSDIYAVGVIAFEALAGFRPFSGKTAVDIAVAHVKEPIPEFPKDTLPPNLDVPIRELIRAMLAKNPSDRPQNAYKLGLEMLSFVPDGMKHWK